ncbi:hypothetical protein LIER_08893 [Lithospermum erythrorhizon]|uniref:Uncharacterized protein n=1 Tax=Lithospermum erythrorhizon TaxID=34254 RepID=A0AAV3PI11_LITER
MVGMFSKFFVGKNGHRRTQSAVDGREALHPNTEVEGAASVRGLANTHGIEIAVEFKPVEHPTEPSDNDRPLQCPLPEPSILNDGRIWKERVSGGLGNRDDLAVIQEGAPALPAEPEAPTTRPRAILPSVSAPEHNILKMLEESGI